MGQVKGNSMHANLNRDLGTKPVMIDDDRNLNELIDSGSLMFTSGYAKDTDLISGTINASFDTITANEYHVTIVSSSVLYAGGSSKFGDTNNDIHTFTGSIYLTGSIAYPELIDFQTVHTTPTNVAGRLTWNDTDGTLNLGLKGGNVTLQVGQEEVVRVVNKTGANLLESQYKVVRVRTQAEGGAQGQRLAVVNAQSSNEVTSATTLGIVTENINVNQEGFITTFGIVRDINTSGALQGESWEDGDALYLSPTTAGGLTKYKPVSPDHLVVMGYVIYAHNTQGKIFVKVDNGYELGELHDVYINESTLVGDVKTTGGSTLYRSGSVFTNNQNVRFTETTTILAHVSASLNYANDTAAAAGGVPLGGIYRNGNVIQIRLV
jgi:hypothetical protein